MKNHQVLCYLALLLVAPVMPLAVSDTITNKAVGYVELGRMETNLRKHSFSDTPQDETLKMKAAQQDEKPPRSMESVKQHKRRRLLQGGIRGWRELMGYIVAVVFVCGVVVTVLGCFICPNQVSCECFSNWASDLGKTTGARAQSITPS